MPNEDRSNAERRGQRRLVSTGTSKAADTEFGRRLREALEQRGIHKLYPLALEIGVDESAISRWRSGHTISLANAVRLAVHLDISLDWLLTGRGHLNSHLPPQEDGPRCALADCMGRHALRLPRRSVPLLIAFLDSLHPPPPG